MIQSQTYLIVADNTGAKKLMCIKILGSNKQHGIVGDILIGVIKTATPNMPIKKSDIVRAIIIRTRHTLSRNDGMGIRFDDNAVIIITKENNPRGTRIFGPVAREIREKKFMKIISLAPEVL